MKVRETFVRPDAALARTPCQLPAATYNLARLLLHRCGEDCLFVPIRSIQYMAVLDAEEFIFLDGNDRRHIELAWQCFQPQTRQALDQPVPYERVDYRPRAAATARYLQSEFHGALIALQARYSTPRPAPVAPLTPRR